MTTTPVQFEGLLSRSAEDELRFRCDRPTLVMVDAVANAEGLSRTELINKVLAKWAAEQARHHTVVGNVLRGNPQAAEALGVRV